MSISFTLAAKLFSPDIRQMRATDPAAFAASAIAERGTRRIVDVIED